jgi:hypothetical protein
MAVSPNSGSQHGAWPRRFGAVNSTGIVASTLRLARCGLLVFGLTIWGVGFAAEIPHAVTSEITSNTSVVGKTPLSQTAGEELKVKVGKSIHPIPVIIAGLLGFVLSLAYLLTKLSKYWGLRVLRNAWSIGFLASGTVFSVLSSPLLSKMTGNSGITSFAGLQSFSDLASPLGASFLGSGFISSLQRVFGRKSRSATGTASNDDPKSNAKGFFFDRIRESLEAQINFEIGHLSEQLDWVHIETLTTKVIIAGETSEGITMERGDKVLKEIEQLKEANVGNQQEENLNKYKALNRALSCVSFKTLRREYLKSLPTP